MRGIAIVGALALLSCSEVRRHPPTMGADQPLTGGEAIALTNELQRVFVEVANTGLERTMCVRTVPQHHDAEGLSVGRYTRRGERAPAQFECVRYRTPGIPGGPTVASHLQAGFALTDLYCDDFFRRIASHSSSRRFSRGLVNDVGAAITAVLGLTNASSAVTGGVGAGFGLVDGTFRNYDEAFLVSADLSTLQARVHSAQDSFRTTTAQGLASITTFPHANSVIIRYANLCSYTGMRHLINESLAEATSPTISLNRMTASLTALFQSIKAIRTAPDTLENSTAKNDTAPAVPANAADVPAVANGSDAAVGNDVGADELMNRM